MDFEEFREKLKEDLGERLFARTGSVAAFVGIPSHPIDT